MDEGEQTKKCRTCGEIRPLSNYSVQGRSGHKSPSPHCKPCAAALERRRIATGITKTPEYRAKINKYFRDNKDKFRERNRRWSAIFRERYPEKAKARRVVRSLLEAGKLVRPDVCEACGGPQIHGRPMHGHHDDYSKPHQVRWLCIPCHNAHHAAAMRADRA